MDVSPFLSDPSGAWSVFEPSPMAPWDLPRVAHLHRRAGFAAPWSVLTRDLNDGPKTSVDRLVNGEPTGGDGLPASESSAMMDAMASRMASGNDLATIQGVWLYRMIFTPHPLAERMTLFWHNHFATSQAKVNNSALMERQNVLLRRHCLGDFQAMLTEMARDPAMLVWLDSTANRKAHPNENYAREVMELFSLGRGHYSEKDVQEAARAFTGGFIRDDRFQEIPSQHDDGSKTILGKSGPFRGDDVSRILLDQPACAEFVCGKLFRQFISEVDPPSPALIAPLADAFRKSGFKASVPVEMILRSKLFHDAAMRRRRVKSPVEFAVGTIRALDILKPTVSSSALAEACSRMGQALFAPPSVAGWDGGPAWINTTTTLARSNFALALIGKDDPRLGGRFDPKALAARHAVEPVKFYVDLLVQDAFDARVRERVKGPEREVAILVMTAPEYQLG